MTDYEKLKLTQHRQALGHFLLRTLDSLHALLDEAHKLDVERDKIGALLVASETEDTKPAEPIRPGEYLTDEIEARCWTLEGVASMSDWLTVQILRELIVGTRRVSRVMSHVLAEVFDQDDATVWLKLQESYDRACAQAHQEE